MVREAIGHVMRFTRTDLQNLLHPDGENEVEYGAKLEKLESEVADM